VEQVGAILDEAVKESVGISSKKWALVLVALVVGALGALWLVRRSGRSEPAAEPGVLETT
jgi:hypothetical protein